MNTETAESVQTTSEVADLELIARGESIIQGRIKGEIDKVKSELSGTSTLLAALLGAAIGIGLTYLGKSPITGDYRYIWSSLSGIVAGGILGERVMLVGFGFLVGLNVNSQ